MRILIVEDERSFRESLAARLEKENISSDGVGTGGEALEKLNNDHFDVVVTDLRLPDIDGIEVIS